MKPGRHRVDGDVARGDFGGERLGHADEARLGGGVIALPRIAGRADHRGDRDDAAPALLHHAAQHGARQAEGGGEIDRDDLIPLVVLHAHEEIVARDAGIVDENVDRRAERGLGRLGQRLDRVLVAEIAGRDEARDCRVRPSGASSASARVPDRTTVAPCACSAFAIAPPMPPEAPVTSAVLPVRSNIIVSSQRLRCRRACRASRSAIPCRCA